MNLSSKLKISGPDPNTLITKMACTGMNDERDSSFFTHSFKNDGCTMTLMTQSLLSSFS